MPNRRTASFDGVNIAYSVSGSAETALIFIHGGMSDRSFWAAQLAAFSERFRVIALDLAGHGESGQNRKEWGILQFGRDVVAVMDAERVSRAVLIGNSLGGPTAVEAALLTGNRVLAVVGVDTFQDMGRTMDSNQMNQMAEAWRGDFHGSMDQMLGALLYSDTEPSLYEDIRQRMSKMPLDSVCAMFRCFGGYDTGGRGSTLSFVRVADIRALSTQRVSDEIIRGTAGNEPVIISHHGVDAMGKSRRDLPPALRDAALRARGVSRNGV